MKNMLKSTRDDNEEIAPQLRTQPLSLNMLAVRFKLGLGLCMFLMLGIGIGCGTAINLTARDSMVHTRWLEGTTWILHVHSTVSTRAVSDANEVAVVKGYDENQIIASTSSWTALRHAFDDHIPFLGRIQRKDFSFFENGELQTLNPEEHQWSTTCFDVPFSMTRRDMYSVDGTSIDGSASINAQFAEDGFLTRMELQHADGRIHHMERLQTFKDPEAGTAFWFARATRLGIQGCGDWHAVTVPERVRLRSVLAMRVSRSSPREPIGLRIGGNASLHGTGIHWMPMCSDCHIHARVACEDDVEIIAMDMFTWDHALATPRIVSTW